MHADNGSGALPPSPTDGRALDAPAGIVLVPPAPARRDGWESQDSPSGQAVALLRSVPAGPGRPRWVQGWWAPLDPVLVVDADAEIRKLVSLALADAGYPAITAATGCAALAAVQQIRPSVILLAPWMPKMDGWTFLECYHRFPPPHAPVIIFATDTRAAARAIALGATASLSKPCSLATLVAVLVRMAGDGTAVTQHPALERPRHGAVLAWEAASWSTE